LREIIGFTAQRLMELEMEGLTGAAHGERIPDRINQRNGYRDRLWETRAAQIFALAADDNDAPDCAGCGGALLSRVLHFRDNGRSKRCRNRCR